MSKIWSRFFLIFALLFGFYAGSAQPDGRDTPKDNSPYSRLGLGDLVNQNFAGPLGYGGLGATFFDYYSLNTINPAANGYLKATAFEVGAFAENSTLKSDGTDVNFWNGNLGYMALAFPMRNPINEVLDRNTSPFFWTMNIGLLPYSTVGYNIEAMEIIEQRDTTFNLFQGRGGLYRIQWGNALRYNDLTFGVNLGYLFGKISNDKSIQFFDGNGNVDQSFYQDDLLDEISLNGLTWNVGLHYKYNFKAMKDGVLGPSGKSIMVGIYGNSASTVNTNTSQEYYRSNPSFANIPVDTIRNLSDIKGNAKLPAEFGFGLMYENEFKFRLGFDYSAAKWSSYYNDAKPESLVDAWRVALGAEYTPDYASYNSQWKRIRYRAGIFYQTDPRVVNEQLTKYGITLGFGVPIIMPRSQVSFINFALELGQFGSESSIQENYIRATLEFTLNDNTWFFKRKFN